MKTLFCFLFAAHCLTAQGAGFSEPNLIIYGKVVNTATTPREPVYLGTLRWTITPPTGASFALEAPLQSLDGGNYSYRVEIPAEKLPPGATLSANTIEASSAAKAYGLNVEFDGSAAVMVLANAQPHPGTTSHSEILRGKIERIDLEVSALPLDSDGDGISDAYENLYASVLNAANGGDAFNDPDGDGAPNIAEFLDGTDPTCHEWLKWVASHQLAAGGLAMAAPEADVDKDGVANILEYAIGTDPRTPDTRIMQQRVRCGLESMSGGQCLVLNVQKAPTSHCNVDYLIEVSDDLVTWKSQSGIDVATLLSDATTLKVRDLQCAGTPSAGRRFMRLKILPQP